LRAHLDDDVSADVGDPEISVAIDLQPMCPGKETLPKRSDVLAGGVELDERLFAAIQHPEMAIRIECNASGRPHRDPRRKGERISDCDVVHRRCILRHQKCRIGWSLSQGGGRSQRHQQSDPGCFHRWFPLTAECIDRL
jgi:hypothetical protein